MANLTLDEMKEVISRGGSVLLPHNVEGGRMLATKHDQLPTEADLAKSSADPAKIAAAREVLEARKKAIDLELTSLDQPTPAARPTPTAVVPPTTIPEVKAEVAPVKPTKSVAEVKPPEKSP